MPPTLKRAHLRELTLNCSSIDAIRSKVIRSSEFADIGNGVSEVKRSERFTHYHDLYHYSYFRVAPRSERRRRTYPIDTLPAELLAHIFILGSSSPHDVFFPITVSHVCGAWRDIALRTPALWQRVSLTSSSHSTCRFDMWHERIYRAKACSLDVELGDGVLPVQMGGRSRAPYFDIHTVQLYMHLVLPFIHRWRSLNISFIDYAPFLWNAALSACCETGRSTHAPLIEQLSLVYPANDDTKEFTLFNGVAPKLKRLTVDGIRLAWPPSLFQNLTFLDYTHRGPIRGNEAVSLVLSMLGVSKQLRELRICFPSGRGMDGSRALLGHVRARRRILLPLLTVLHLRIDGPAVPSELTTLLPRLSFPSLTSLNFLDSKHSPEPFAHLKAFFRVFRIPPTLRYLYMDYGWVEHHILPSLFRSLKAVRRIMISGACLPDPYFVGFEVRRMYGGVFVAERAI